MHINGIKAVFCNGGCSNEIIAVNIQILLKSKQNENYIYLAVYSYVYSYVYACMYNVKSTTYGLFQLYSYMYKCEYNIINVATCILSSIAILSSCMCMYPYGTVYFYK